MRVPLFWLREHCDPGLPAQALAERLAMTGTEVDRIVTHGVAALEHFVVGRVLDARQHPNADRLRVCVVAVGEGDTARIVCGAPNVAAGQAVAVARPGAVMPDGTRLKRAKLRGEVSEGMILAEDELGIGTDHAGILVLGEDGDAPEPGTPLADVLPIATDVLELEITPNRPDCLGIYGVAREVHAATGAPLAPPPWADDPGSEGEVAGVRVEVQDARDCPRLTARVFEDVRIGPSPPWLKARLMAAGQRPISNVVDITNYVMLLTGHPLHAWDLDRVAGGLLRVRRARAGERLETLDGQLRALDPGIVIFEDEQGPSSLAGVMGGARTEVSDATTRVLMEVAVWDGPTIQRTSTRLGLRSEASARFEKGLQPETAMWAQAVAAQLMVELCGARLAPGTVDVGGPGPAPRTIRLREARVAGLLGAPIPRERCAQILTALDFGVRDAEDGLDVTVPAFRRDDVTREADLIEEVARIDGLEKLPATLPKPQPGGLTPRQRALRRVEAGLTGRGAHEIVGWSFASPELADRLRLAPGDPRRDRAVALRNPMSAEGALLRTLLLPSLLDVARFNAARGRGELRLFEAGPVYRRRAGEEVAANGGDPRAAREGDPDPDRDRDEPAGPVAERRHLALVLAGPVRPPTWREPRPPEADLFAAKGLLGAVLDELHVPWAVRAQPEPEPFLHPGRAADVLLDGEPAGWLGELHPSVAASWDLGRVACLEVDLDRVLTLAAGVVRRYEDVTSFPAVRQDIAVALADDVPAADAVAVVRRAGGPELRGVDVFDVYAGEQVGPGRRSLALRLEFRAPDRTLTDEEVAGRRRAIERALAEELGGALRG